MASSISLKDPNLLFIKTIFLFKLPYFVTHKI